MREPSSNKRIGLQEIATAAGVSRMTVSLALRNHPSLPIATRQKIQDVATRLGYRPDPDMGQLMEKVRERKKHRLPSIIAYITGHETRDGWRQSTTQASYFEGAFARAAECGYRLDNFWLREPKMTEARLSSILSNRSIEGVIIAPFPDSQVISEAFRWDYFSAVQLGYSNLKLHIYRSCNHQFQSMKLLVQSLQQAGYRKIGLVMPASQDERANNNWRGAYLTGQGMLPDAQPIPMLLSADLNRQQFANWLKKYKPEAIVTVGNDISRWLAELKVRVPEDVGLANVDLTSEMGNATGINQNSNAVGAAAVDHLVTLMRLSERGIPQIPKILMVEGSFVQGATTFPKFQR